VEKQDGEVASGQVSSGVVIINKWNVRSAVVSFCAPAARLWDFRTGGVAPADAQYPNATAALFQPQVVFITPCTIRPK
jgi:hypothetical protein